MKGYVLTAILGEDFEKIVAGDNGEQGLDLDDILKDTDYYIKPDPVEDPSDPPDASAWDRQASPIVSPIASPTTGPGDESRWDVVQPRARSSPRPPPVPPPSHPSPPPHAPQEIQLARKRGTIKPWTKSKKLFAKFGGGDKPPPEVSVELLSGRDDETKWYDTLLSKPQKPTAGTSGKVGSPYEPGRGL